jgi:hypothetical protein
MTLQVTHKLIAASIMLCALFSAAAQDVPISIFTEALEKGSATTDLPLDDKFASLAKAIKDRTGDDGPIVIYAKLIKRFSIQKNCGRIAFVVAQPSAHIAWDDLGGQLNICEDGQPPKKECKSDPAQLYPAGAICPDGTHSQNTTEVEEAIKQALSTGGLTHDQVKEKMQLSKDGPKK